MWRRQSREMRQRMNICTGSPGIGSSCRSQDYGGYTKNIRISGGNVTAKGNEYCSGIGSGYADRCSMG